MVYGTVSSTEAIEIVSSYHKINVEMLKEFYLNKKIFVSRGHLSLFWHLQLKYSDLSILILVGLTPPIVFLTYQSSSLENF